MGKNAPFGRPGVLDRLRPWWYAKDRSFRANSLLGLAVGGVAVGLIAAAVSRQPAPSTGLANAARPHLTTGGLPNPPVTVDIRAAGGVATPLGLPDQSSTSSTVATAPMPASTTPPARPASTAAPARPAGTPTTAPPTVATTAPAPALVYSEVPPPPTPDPAVPPPPATTHPPATTPPTAPPSTSPTTTITLLPPISLPRLLP